MEARITGRHLRLTKAIRAYVEKRLDRVAKYRTLIINPHIILIKIKDNFVAEAHFKLRTTEVACKAESGESMYSAIDLLMDVLARRLKKENEKLKNRRSRGKIRMTPLELPQESFSEVKKPELVRVSPRDIKPMFPEDAMEELKSSNFYFLPFINAQTEELNVIYKRGDGNYGLIEQ